MELCIFSLAVIVVLGDVVCVVVLVRDVHVSVFPLCLEWALAPCGASRL